MRAWGEEYDAVAEYPMLVGAQVSLSHRFGAIGLPATAIVAPDGTIDTLIVGLSSYEELEERVAFLVDEASRG